MSFENKPGQGVLFLNEKRTEKNNQPHYRGVLKLLNGEEIEISAWGKHDKRGKKFFSIAQGKPYKKEDFPANKEALPF